MGWLRSRDCKISGACGVGAGARTATPYATGKKDICLPSETRLYFVLNQALTITRAVWLSARPSLPTTTFGGTPPSPGEVPLAFPFQAEWDVCAGIQPSPGLINARRTFIVLRVRVCNYPKGGQL